MGDAHRQREGGVRVAQGLREGCVRAARGRGRQQDVIFRTRRPTISLAAAAKNEVARSRLVPTEGVLGCVWSRGWSGLGSKKSQ
jgi:hypothetical protein